MPNLNLPINAAEAAGVELLLRDFREAQQAAQVIRQRLDLAAKSVFARYEVNEAKSWDYQGGPNPMLVVVVPDPEPAEESPAEDSADEDSPPPVGDEETPTPSAEETDDALEEAA